MVFACSVKLKYFTNCKIWVHIFVMEDRSTKVGTNKIKNKTNRKYFARFKDLSTYIGAYNIFLSLIFKREK